MEQTASGFLVIGWKLALAVVAGSSILTTIGVWALARFTTVFDAYAGERAKLLAQFHNLDKLVEQTEKLTATTEAIKARVSDEVWDRQRRWNFKRDLYVRLLEAFGECSMSFYEWKGAWETHRKNPTNAEFVKALQECQARYRTRVAALIRALAVAPLVASAQALDEIRKLATAVSPINANSPTLEVDMEKQSATYITTVPLLQQAAKVDLGYDSQPQ